MLTLLHPTTNSHLIHVLHGFAPSQSIRCFAGSNAQMFCFSPLLTVGICVAYRCILPKIEIIGRAPGLRHHHIRKAH